MFFKNIDRAISIFGPMDECESEFCKLINEIGFTRAMQLAQLSWAKYNRREDTLSVPGSEFVVGPCASMVVECGCEKPYECDWCCGSGWLTKMVKKAKDKK